MTQHDLEQDTSTDTPIDPGKVAETVENILDFDAFMSSARRAIRTVPLCARADLQDEYDRACQELATLVTPSGEIFADGEKSLADAAHVDTLTTKITDLLEQMQAATSYVVVEALSDDDWDAFQAEHRDRSGKVKDVKEYINQMIARSAIKPTLTADQVKQLRGKVSAGQIGKLADATVEANESEGLDVPKLPSFLPTQRSQGSSTS